MRIAHVNLRHNVPERTAAVEAGFARHGYTVKHQMDLRPGPRDVFLTWNRIGAAQTVANAFEFEQRPVLVMENASWGNSFANDRWYTIGRNYHNLRAGSRDSLRWDSLGIDLEPWRTSGQTVILPSRGIGPPRVAMPLHWTHKIVKHNPGARVRMHPGRGPETPLDWDLKHAGRVITWGSGAAIKACMWGVLVESHLPNWIGEQDNTDAGRLRMLQCLAWQQWRLTEIADGTAFEFLLNH